MDLPYSFGAVPYIFVRYGESSRRGKIQVKKHYPNGEKRGMILH